jgi:hypothetical protein
MRYDKAAFLALSVVFAVCFLLVHCRCKAVTLLVGQSLSTTRALLASVKTTIITIILFINNNFYFYFLNCYF